MKEVSVAVTLTLCRMCVSRRYDPTIAKKFNTYRIADYKEKVTDLLKRVTTVSVGTMDIVTAIATAAR